MGLCAGKGQVEAAATPEAAAEGTMQSNLQRKHKAQRMRGKAVRGDQTDMDALRNYTPKSVPKEQDETDLIVRSLRQNFLFASVPANILNMVADKMAKMNVNGKGTDLIKQGDEKGDKFYVIQKGEIDFYVNGVKVNTKKPAGSGDNFGELALMYDCPRAATCKLASDTAVLWTLDRLAFKKLLVHSVQTQQEASSKSLSQMLKEITVGDEKVFAKLPAEKLTLVIDTMVTSSFPKGQTIVRQGMKGDVFYIVKEGEVTVEKDGVDVASLKSNDYFGELALLRDEPRNATIKAKTDVVLLGVDRNTFSAVVNNKLRQKMEEAAKVEKQKETQMLAAAKASQQAVALSQCNTIAVLGKGAFGLVKLVKVGSGKKGQVYALKVLQKKQLLQTKQFENVVNEKRVMQIVGSNSFCLRLVSTMKDQQCLYLLLEFLQGGDLFSRLCESDGYLELRACEYYAACVVSAFECIHGNELVYRDLKPENLVLDSKGVLKVVDFGMAKKCKKKTFTVCGTPDYMAPEIINIRGHDKGADYWALGVLIFEMSTGTTPFGDASNNHRKIYQNIQKNKPKFPSTVQRNSETVDLIKRLLHSDSQKRLGCLKNGTGDVMSHSFFKHTKWDLLETERPPWEPHLKGALDTSKFDDWGKESQYPTMPYTPTGAKWDLLWEQEF